VNKDGLVLDCTETLPSSFLHLPSYHCEELVKILVSRCKKLNQEDKEIE